MLAAAVLGSPIAHSLSPVLHQAAYHALGLTEWDYVRIECTAADLPGIVAGTAPETRGFSVTMPCKDAALRFADVVSTRAHLVESANTLVRQGDGWYADCTDIDGALAALECVGHTGGDVLLLGAGATARPCLAALQQCGAGRVSIASRSEERAQPTLHVAAQLGIDYTWVPINDPDVLQDTCATADTLISTLPGDAAAGYGNFLRRTPRLVDVVYAPWPTSLARIVADNGGKVVGGRTMLVHQAVAQIEMFTGMTVTDDVFAAMVASLNAA